MTTAIVRFCIKCDADKQVDPISWRCLTCGRSTGDPNVAARMAGQQPRPVDAAAVTLPSTVASRRWIDQTHALADGFAKAANEAEAKAAGATAEAERLRRAATAFLGLLKQVSIDPEAEHTERSPRSLKSGRWARDYDACVVCGTTERKHESHGRCTTCTRALQKASAA